MASNNDTRIARWLPHLQRLVLVPRSYKTHRITLEDLRRDCMLQELDGGPEGDALRYVCPQCGGDCSGGCTSTAPGKWNW